MPKCFCLGPIQFHRDKVSGFDLPPVTCAPLSPTTALILCAAVFIHLRVSNSTFLLLTKLSSRVVGHISPSSSTQPLHCTRSRLSPIPLAKCLNDAWWGAHATHLKFHPNECPSNCMDCGSAFNNNHLSTSLPRVQFSQHSVLVFSQVSKSQTCNATLAYP